MYIDVKNKWQHDPKLKIFPKFSAKYRAAVITQCTVYCNPYTPFSSWHQLTAQCTGTAVAQWLSCCATNRKVAGSLPTGVIGYFIDIKSFRSHYGPGVDSASNRNEYQGHFLGVKEAGA